MLKQAFIKQNLRTGLHFIVSSRSKQCEVTETTNTSSNIIMNSSICICLCILIASAMTFPQSSFYAGNRRGNYPALLPRFGGDDDTAVGNRFGESDNNGTTSSNPSDLIHDPAVVDRVATWPKDRQPFWFLNSQHINSQRGQQIPCNNCLNPQQSAQQPLPQSPFANNKS